MLNDAIFSATFNVSSTKLETGRTLLTNPYENAVYASINSPVKVISIAFDLPTALINLWVPPHPGI